MKKILSLLACVCLLFTTIMIPASAAETSATISFATKDARVSIDNSSQVWSANGLTVTNNKGASTSNVADYANPVRFYKNSDVIITYPGMTKIEIDVTGVQKANKEAWVNSCSDATLDGNTVTITLAAPVDSYTITLTAAQARAMAITVYAADGNTGSGSGEDVTPPAEPEVKTIAEILAMEDGDTEFYVTAEIVETSGNSWATYGNFLVKDDSTDATLLIYGLYDENGNRYDAMETKPVVGDTIKVKATRSSYNGNPQLKNAVLVELTPATPDEGGDDVTPPAEPEVKTIAEVLAMEDSDTKFIVTAEIVETYGNSWATYGNFKLKDDSTDETIILYGLKDENGNRYDAMETKPVVGDTVKVIANRGSYNGAGQLNNAVLLELTPATPDEGGEDVTPEPPAEPEVKTIAEILAMEDSDTKFIVTAEIVDTYGSSWATWGNFILKDDSTDETIILYGLDDENGNRYDAMETKPVVGDTIKVIANRSSYNGVGQLANAVLLELTPATPDEGGEDVTPEPPAEPEEKTIAEVLAMEDSDTKFIVTAKIVDTYRDTWATYGNFILKDDSTDETIILYGLKDENGNRYDAMETKPVVGDTIKVIANRSSYNGVGQLANAVLLELTPATPDEGGDDNTGNEGGDDNTGNEGGDGVTPPAGDATLNVVKNPVAGTAYKFGMVQENLGKTLYITGEMSSYYYATTEDPEAAADVYLEETDGGYYMYAMVNGAKKYMNIIEATGTDGKVHINAVFGDTAISVFTYDATLETFVTALGEKSYGFGTRSDANYNTVSPSASEYVDNFFCSFYAEASTDDSTNGSTDGSTDDDNTADDDSTTPPSTGVGSVSALAVMAIAAAAVALSKKRA